MISPLKAKLAKYLFSYDWEIVEIMGASFKTMWGIWLLLPFRTFRMIEGYNAWGNENYWGWGLLILGVCHFAAIYSKKLKFRRSITFIAFLFWVFTVILVALQSKTAAIIPMFSIIAFFMGINFLRLGIEPRSEVKKNESSSNSIN